MSTEELEKEIKVKRLVKKKYSFKQYCEYIEALGCCPCGYLVHDDLSKYTHWDLHRKNKQIVKGFLKL